MFIQVLTYSLKLSRRLEVLRKLGSLSMTLGTPLHFWSSKKPKHHKMLVEKFTLNTKDQGTVKQWHILLCHF